MTHNNKHFNKSSLSKQTRNLTFVLCMGMLAGVLIWAKLRLVTDIPRSAYADPRELEPTGSDLDSVHLGDIQTQIIIEHLIDSESPDQSSDSSGEAQDETQIDSP